MLKTEWQAFVDTHPYGLRIERDLDVVEVFFQVLKEVPPRLLAILGDLLHNLRGALDYTAVALVAANGGDISRAAFPIYLSEEDFIRDIRCRGKRRSPGPLDGIPIESKEGTFIESLQPYKRGDAMHADPLYSLVVLSNRDKHRMLNPAYGGMIGEDGLSILQWNTDAILIEGVAWWKSGMPLREGAKIAWLRFDTRGAYPTMGVKNPLAIEIFFASESKNGIGPTAGLGSIRTHVAQIVNDAEVFFS